MNIITAIDIKNGKIVKAFAGYRINYKPLIINKKDYSKPDFYLKMVIEKLGYKNIYIADLDSINGSMKNWLIIKRVITYYQNINFFLDLGFDNLIKLISFRKFIDNDLIFHCNWKPVVGSETLKKNNKVLIPFKRNNAVFSLDFTGNENFWLKNKKINKIFDEIILMFVKKVGGRGINWRTLSNLQGYIDKSKCIIAGGIKYSGEINNIRRIGYKGVIISTLTHKEIK